MPKPFKSLCWLVDFIFMEWTVAFSAFPTDAFMGVGKPLIIDNVDLIDPPQGI